MYFAYGSNINLDQMAYRCPAAQVVGPVVLEGYELLFRGNASGNGVATIKPKEGQQVHGLLWRITPGCERSLDLYEGYPHLYEKGAVAVRDNAGRQLTVMAYVMTDGDKLSCIGRDIEYREVTLERNGENVWELVSDSRTQPELLGDRIVYLLSELMRDRTEFIGTPTELSERIDPVGVERISPKKVSRQILQNLDALSKIGISVVMRRSNGKRVIELRRADSVDLEGAGEIVPIDPVGALCGDLRAVSRCGE